MSANSSFNVMFQKHFKEEKRKEAPFICQLVTAVAESCLINKGSKLKLFQNHPHKNEKLD